MFDCLTFHKTIGQKPLPLTIACGMRMLRCKACTLFAAVVATLFVVKFTSTHEQALLATLPERTVSNLTITGPIPNLIHQTWKTSAIPEWAAPCVDSWRLLNPAHEQHLWTDLTALSLVQERYPDLHAVWHRLKPVEKADAIRYVVVHAYGGVYADIDVRCERPIASWPSIGNATALVGVETILKSEEERARLAFSHMKPICQWTFAAAPKHWILKNAIDIIVQNVRTNASDDPLTKTGPGVFTNAVIMGSAAEREGMVLLEPAAFAIGGHRNPRRPVKETLVSHRFRGSWKASWMVNEDPSICHPYERQPDQ